MNQFSIILIFILCIYEYLCKSISCAQNCTFGSSINVGSVNIPLEPNQLCFITSTDSDLIIDITENGLDQCLGVTVPTDNIFYCENDGDQECILNCGCDGLYSLCYNHVKITKKNQDMVCIQKEGKVKDVSFHPRCSQYVEEMCGNNPSTCPCLTCTNDNLRFKDENHCGEGYYMCVNNEWKYNSVNETTVCGRFLNSIVCHNEPYCQAGPDMCYNGQDDTAICKLPTNNTCVKQCVAGKGYWNCNNTSCEEAFNNTLDKNNTACHNKINGYESVDLLDFNNVCQCPSTDCTTTSTTTPSPTECPERPPGHHDGKPNYDVCPKEFGNFCITPYRRGVGFVKCHHYIPLYIRIQEFEICIQTDPTHIVVREAH